MGKFNLEASRNEFIELCTAVLPEIGSIEQALEKGGVTDGVSIRFHKEFMEFDVWESEWRMVRHEKNGPTKIIYEHSEEIQVPESDRKLEYGHLTENIMNITLAYAELLKEDKNLEQINLTTWQQRFVEWANEFEAAWNDSKDYPEEIVKFAKRKIAEYAGQEEK